LQELLDFLKRVGEEKLKDLPPGVGSGKKAPDGRRGLFVHLKGGGQHFWLFYDLSAERFLERKLEVIKLVRCKENEPAVQPDFDVWPIIEKAKRYIVNRLRQARWQLPRLKSPQNHILNWLKTRRDERARKLLAYFKEPLPETHLKRLRRIWRDNRGDEEALIEKLETFAEQNPLVKPEQPEVPELTEEDLELVCYMALV